MARMIVIDELPFQIVENEGFKQFMSVACPNFRVPSRYTIAHDCVRLYNSEFENLKLFLKNSCQRLCLAANTWTSIQIINYMVLTDHFIDNYWKLHKRILNFCPISGHKGDAISSAIDKCLRYWEVDKKVFTITVDNAILNDKTISSFKKKMSNWDSSILKGEFVHIRCIAHILNLIVTDGLKDIDKYVENVRNMVRYVRQLPARLIKFRECAKIENFDSKKSLCLDVQTRWNLTYMMLDVAQQYERAFDRLEELGPYFKLDFQDLDWVDKKDDFDCWYMGSMDIP